MGNAILIRHFEQSRCDWQNHTTWYGSHTTWYGRCHFVSVSTRLYVIGWTIPHGSTRIDITSALPDTWNCSQYCFMFLHNTDANMLCRLFDDCKYMDIYLPIHQNYCYLGKQKISLYLSASTCEHLWPSHSHLVNCVKCLHHSREDAADWSVWKVF